LQTLSDYTNLLSKVEMQALIFQNCFQTK